MIQDHSGHDASITHSHNPGVPVSMRNKSISKHVRYKLKLSDKTKRCPTQVKDVR